MRARHEFGGKSRVSLASWAVTMKVCVQPLALSLILISLSMRFPSTVF